MDSCTRKLFNCSNCSFGFQSTALNQGQIDIRNLAMQQKKRTFAASLENKIRILAPEDADLNA